MVRLKAQYAVQQASRTLAQDVSQTWEKEHSGGATASEEDADVSDLVRLRREMGLDDMPDFGPLDTETGHAGSSIPVTMLNQERRHFSVLYENINRLTGVTGFKVRDPSTGGYMLGIRFDVAMMSSSSSCTFGVPHYILLHRRRPPAASRTSKGLASGTSDRRLQLHVFAHTVPAYVPLPRLAEAYLNTNLKLFVKAVRSALVLHAARTRAIAILGKLPGVRKVEANQGCTEATLRLGKRHGSAEIVVEFKDDQVAHARRVTPGRSATTNRLVRLLIGNLVDLPQRLKDYAS